MSHDQINSMVLSKTSCLFLSAVSIISILFTKYEKLPLHIMNCKKKCETKAQNEQKSEIFSYRCELSFLRKLLFQPRALEIINEGSKKLF